MTTNTQQFIRIKRGDYGRHVIADEVFPLIGNLSRNPKGQLYVTVDGAQVDVPGIEARNCRIKVKSPESIQIISKDEFDTARASSIPAPRKEHKTEAEKTLDYPKQPESEWPEAEAEASGQPTEPTRGPEDDARQRHLSIPITGSK